MDNPISILKSQAKKASNLNKRVIDNPEIRNRIKTVTRCPNNKAGTRLLLAGALAKIHKPDIDIRKPYTRIASDDSYSGRTYDEHYVIKLINEYDLPCNSTTAFLTPALRNRDITLTKDVNLEGRPKEMYDAVIYLFDEVYKGNISAEDLLEETIRELLILKKEKKDRIDSFLKDLNTTSEIYLSSEDILTLIAQHLSCRGSSRLPVLVVASAYKAAEKNLNERVLPLLAHNAADEQTGSLGDLEITLLDNEDVITSYEMKLKKVTEEDIDRAVQKIANSGKQIDNYIFITTEEIEYEVSEYAKEMYEMLGGIEVAILDCLSFLRHFLHLFHRLRRNFLDYYQEMVLDEPESAVSEQLKEAFLALRYSAESNLNID